MIAIGAYQPGLQPTRRSASRSWLRGNGRASLLAQRHALSGLSGGGSPEPTQEQVLQVSHGANRVQSAWAWQ